MADTAMIAFFLCFGLLSMVWLKQRRRMRIRRRRRSILARRIRTAAFCASQEAELRAAVTALATDLLLRSSVHRRSYPRSISAKATSSRARSTFVLFPPFLHTYDTVMT